MKNCKPLTISGVPFSPRSAAILNRAQKDYGFDSPYWIEDHVIHAMEWRVRERYCGQHCRLFMRKYFNAENIVYRDNFEKKVVFDQENANRMVVPLNVFGDALTFHAFCDARAAMLQDARLSPYWLTQHDMKVFGVGVQCVGGSPQPPKSIGGYINAADTTDPALFSPTTCFQPYIRMLDGDALSLTPQEVKKLATDHHCSIAVDDETFAMVQRRYPFCMSHYHSLRTRDGQTVHLISDYEESRRLTPIFWSPKINNHAVRSFTAAQLRQVALRCDYPLEDVHWYSQQTADKLGWDLMEGSWTHVMDPCHVGLVAHSSQFRTGKQELLAPLDDENNCDAWLY